MNVVEAALKRAYKDMDRDGMYPADWTCRSCGKVLNAGGQYPAELYAGTYNGLCYSCTSGTSYVEAVYEMDGAQRWSHPPTTPSWRRDREDSTGYPDCEKCKGTGTAGMRYTSQWGSRYRERCQDCTQRFYANRQHWTELDRRMREAAENRYQRAVKAYALRVLGKKKAAKKAVEQVIADTDPAVWMGIRVPILWQVERAKARLRTLEKRDLVWTKRRPTPEEMTDQA